MSSVQISAVASALAHVPPPVQFTTRPESNLNSRAARHCPLAGVTIRTRQPGQAPADRITELHALADFLNVERSLRYLPDSSQTFCNLYAYDYCYLAGAYLPRVWWNSRALVDISHGGKPAVIYDKTVRELTANSLYSWLREWGGEYGWQACMDVDDLQSRVNQGAVGVICAQRMVLSRSGHITVVLPEVATKAAERLGGIVTKPLQSQAGAKNKQHFASRWWIDRAAEFRATGFWVWE